MRRRTLPGIVLMIVAGLGRAAPESPLPAEDALFLEARGKWEEAAAQHLADSRTAVSLRDASLALASALADLATVGRQCSSLADQAAAEMRRLRAAVWSRDRSARLPGRALLWLDLQAGSCHSDGAAARRLRAGGSADGVGLAEVWTALGDLSRQEQDLEAAVDEYALALDRQQNGVAGAALRVRMAETLLRMGRLDQADRMVEALEVSHIDPARGPRRDVLWLKGRLARLQGHPARAFTLMGQAAQEFPEGERRWSVLRRQASVAREAGLAKESLQILNNLSARAEDSPSLTAARLELAERLQNSGEAGETAARKLFRRVLDSAGGADAGRALSRLVDSWITSGHPLRAFAELAVLIRSQDALLVALARQRFAAMLPRYLDIFAGRRDLPSIIVLYRLAEGVWMLAPLDSTLFVSVGKAYDRLGLPRQALDLTALAFQAAAGHAQKERIRLMRARLLEKLDRHKEALELLLDPDESGCSRVAAAANLAGRTGAAVQFVRRFGHKDLSSCDAAVKRAVSRLPSDPLKAAASKADAVGAA
ncbi:MAG: tetratricopeptide repeat protein [Acidobacteriota bacterium]